MEQGKTSVTSYVVLRDTNDLSPKTGLTAAQISIGYMRPRSLPVWAEATALGAVDTAFSAGKVIEVDSSGLPGVYRVDWPDAAFVAGVDQVMLAVKSDDASFATWLELKDLDPVEVSLSSDGKAAVQDALDTQGLTGGRAALLDNLDIAISEIDIAGALDTQGLTAERAALLENLDALVSEAGGGDLEAVLLSLGYTAARATKLDRLDAAVSSVSGGTPSGDMFVPVEPYDSATGERGG